jgi:hypothetical protein
MSDDRGIFDLKTPKDLLNKLRHDYDRMSQQPANSYPAFDFFVAAHHLFEWACPQVKGELSDFLKRKSDYENDLLETCRAIANGSKHFKPNKNTQLSGSAFDPHVFDNSAVQVGKLIVELKGQVAAELGLEVEALVLAGKVLEFWERYPGLT